MGKGSNTTTTNQSQTYNPLGAAQIKSALDQGQAAAQTPFQLPVAPVAGFSQDQQNAFTGVQNAQGMALPYMNTAASYFSPQGAQQFFNPYASNVMAGLSDIFGQQASQNTGQLTQAAGGVGADRIAVGQGNLAKQQGLAAGQTLSGLYSGAAQQAQSAGYGLGALGSAAQNSVLQGLQAELGTGGLQQQLNQAQLNAPFQNRVAQLAYPFQTAQFNAGITGSLAPGLGGTTTGQGTTTGPAPSMLSQILGLGTAGIGAAGGLGAFGGSPSYGGGSGLKGDAYGGSSANPLPGLSASDYGAGYAGGGEVESSPFDLPPNFNDKPINVAEHSIIPMVQTPAIRPEVPKLNLNPPAQSSGSSGGLGDIAKTVMSIAPFFLAQGGAVRNPYEAFADGGAPDDDAPATFDERFPYRMTSPGAYEAWRNDTPATPMAFASPESSAAFPPPRGAHGRSMGAPAPAAAPDAAEELSGPSPAAVTPSQSTPAAKDDRFIDSPWAALMAAGLGIAGGTSPFAAVNIGQGGMQGLKTLQEQRASGQKDETIAQATRRLDLEAKHHEDQFTRMTPYQKYETSKPVPMGQTIGPLGLPMTTYGIPDGKGGYTPVHAPTPTTQEEADNPVKNIVEGIKSGKLPPDTTGLYRLAPAVKSGLAKDGFDLTQAQLEMAAAKKQILSLNGPQMVRFVGLAKSVDQTINEVKQLSEQMKNSGIPLLNQAKISELMQLEGNSEKGQLAARYVGAVNTLKEEFANLANGGYAPTEPAWKLANEQINGNYGVKQLGASLEEVQRLIRYRLQGIPNMNTLGPGSNNRYVPGAIDSGAGHAPATAASPAAPVAVASPEEARKLPSGTPIRLPDGRIGTVP